MVTTPTITMVDSILKPLSDGDLWNQKLIVLITFVGECFWVDQLFYLYHFRFNSLPRSYYRKSDVVILVKVTSLKRVSNFVNAKSWLPWAIHVRPCLKSAEWRQNHLFKVSKIALEQRSLERCSDVILLTFNRYLSARQWHYKCIFKIRGVCTTLGGISEQFNPLVSDVQKWPHAQ